MTLGSLHILELDFDMRICIAIIFFKENIRQLEDYIHCFSGKNEFDFFILSNGGENIDYLRRENVHVFYSENHGFSSGHNLILSKVNLSLYDFYIVSNYDITISPSSLLHEIKSNCLTNCVYNCLETSTVNGEELVYDLSSIPSFFQKVKSFLKLTSNYKRIVVLDRVPVQCLSGSFIIIGKDVLSLKYIFDPGFFMYFEDFDLADRLSRRKVKLFRLSLKYEHVKQSEFRINPELLKVHFFSAKTFYINRYFRKCLRKAN